MQTIRIRLGKDRDKSLVQGHPWLFSGGVARADGPEDAPVAEVENASGKRLGVGFYSPRSQIRVRMLGHDGPVDRSFFAERLKTALRLREKVLPPETTGYRLFNAEGDGIPGWTLDRYGDVVVSQITVAGLEALRADAYAALGELLPGVAVLQANRVRSREEEGISQDDEVVAGEPGAAAEFLESGLRFTAELGGGQKTGFYCDQRPNRRLVERLAGGGRVLDLFAHSGTFGVYALRGGAERVTAVESSARLIERGREHVAANGFAEEAVEWVKANVFEDLRQREDLYDVVVCDPPPLVTRRGKLQAGTRAYKDLNRLALKRVRPGGFLLTFSCSAAVDAKLFRQVFFAAAVEAGVRVALLRTLGPGEDHPVAITHPQGEYLKGWLATVG